MRQLWPLRARTPEGKRAKIEVLFAYVLGRDGHRSDWDIMCVRQLLFKLGGVRNEDILKQRLERVGDRTLDAP
jgi:hypothetical protein